MQRSTSAPLVAALLCAVLAPAGAAQSRTADPEQAIGTALESVHGPADVIRAGRELAQLGLAGLEPLFAHFAAGQGTLSPAQALALTSALGALPHEAVFSFLAHLTRASATSAQLVAGFELLASFGARSELKLVLDLAGSGADASALEPEVRTALEKALSGICAREDGAANALTSFFSSVTPALQASIVSSLARVAGPQVPSLLAALLGSSTADADVLLLLELGNHASSFGACDDQLVLERVRAYLARPDGRLSVLACLALEKLRDYQAVPDLVVLLDDANPALRQRAHAALHSLTGLEFGPETEPWMTWLSSSLAWWDERSDACRVALVSGSPAEAAAALSEAAEQRLFAADVVQLLDLAAQRPERDLVLSACRSLGSIHEPCAIEALEAALARAEPAASDEIQGLLLRAARRRPPQDHPPAIPTLPRSVTP